MGKEGGSIRPPTAPCTSLPWAPLLIGKDEGEQKLVWYVLGMQGEKAAAAARCAPEALIDALGDAEPHGLLHALDFLAAREEGNPQSRPQPLYAFHIMLRAYGWVLSLLDKAMSEVGPMVGANLLKLTSMLALPLICGVALPSRTGLPFCHFAHDLSACGQKCKNLACKVSCCRGSYRKETRVTAIKAKQGNWAKRTCQGLRDLPWERKGKDCGKEKGQLHLCQKSCWKRLSELENPCTAVTVGSKRLLASMKGKETCENLGEEDNVYCVNSQKRKDHAGQIQLHASSENSLTGKLARASPNRLTGPAKTKLGANGKQLVRVRRVASHTPAGVDSPLSALHCLAPSDSPTELECMVTSLRGFFLLLRYCCYGPLNKWSDGFVSIDCACHTKLDGAQGHLVVSVWISEATSAKSGTGTSMLGSSCF
eukprot:1156361-Pelagomonas_calceolata.AAC.2